MRIARVHNLHMESAEKTDAPKSKEIEINIRPILYLENLGIFDDEKEFYRFIVRTKFYIRQSYEYKELMKFLKNSRGMDRCGVHPNVRVRDGFPINIHHTPLVLEDIVHIIIAKRQKLNESLTMSAIAKEVMELHYLGLFGLYPLCETCHEYAHGETNDLFIPLDALFGDPEKFFDIYDEFISEALKHKFENIKVLNQGYSIIKSEIPEGLMRKYIYVKTAGDQQVMSSTALADFIRQLNEEM